MPPSAKAARANDFAEVGEVGLDAGELGGAERVAKFGDRGVGRVSAWTMILASIGS